MDMLTTQISNVELDLCKGGECVLRRAGDEALVIGKLQFFPSNNTGEHSGEYKLTIDESIAGKISFATMADGRVFIMDTKNETLKKPQVYKDIGVTLVGAVIQGLPSESKVVLISLSEALDFWKKLGFLPNDPHKPVNYEATAGQINSRLLARAIIPHPALSKFE